MRTALDPVLLRDVYRRAARHYDLQHALLTLGSDQRGRSLLVRWTVRPADRVLDAGAGTGGTGLLAARRAGPGGKVTMLDFSAAMLSVARRKAVRASLAGRLAFVVGDMVRLPFQDDVFDVALSTYSLCPLYDPERGARELLRVVRPGGKIGIAHSTEPRHPLLRRLAARVEDWAWRFPGLTLGCRAVHVLPVLERAGARVLHRRRIGVPLWPFLVGVLEKPAPA